MKNLQTIGRNKMYLLTYLSLSYQEKEKKKASRGWS